MWPLIILFVLALVLVLLKKVVFKVDKDSLPDRLLELGITVCVTGFSFYGSYLLAQLRTNDEKKEQALNFVRTAMDRNDTYYSFLFAFDARNPAFSDSVILNFYNKNKSRRAFFVLDALSADQAAVAFDSSTYRLFSTIEDNEKSTLITVNDTTETRRERVKHLLFSHRFGNLKMDLLKNQEQYLGSKISDDERKEEFERIKDTSGTFLAQVIKLEGGLMK